MAVRENLELNKVYMSTVKSTGYEDGVIVKPKVDKYCTYIQQSLLHTSKGTILKEQITGDATPCSLFPLRTLPGEDTWNHS